MYTHIYKYNYVHYPSRSRLSVTFLQTFLTVFNKKLEFNYKNMKIPKKFPRKSRPKNMKYQFLQSIFLILNLLLVFLISFSLSFSVYKHQNNLFLSTYEFIVVVKSSRVVAFFIFNAIVIAIFFGSFKPFRDYDHYSYIPVSTCANYQADHDHHRDVKEEANGHDYEDDGDDFSSDDDILYIGNISDLGYDEDNDDDDGNDDDDSSDEDYGYDDQEKYIDLQRRSEDFIEKNNKRWIEELRSERFLCIAAATEILTSSSS